MPVSIMLDAGHGGRDPGAVYNGRQEKDDVLKLVLAIGEILQNSGIDVEYTRTTDIYETPFQKATEANEAGVDFFISIHRNSSPLANQYMGVESLIFHQEKLDQKKVLGCIVGFAGVVLINLSGSNVDMSFNLTGDGFIFISAIAYALSSVLIKKYSAKSDPVMLSGYQFTAGGLVMILIGFVMGGRIHTASMPAMILLIYMALISAVAYTLWGILLKYNPVSKVSIFGFTNPLFGVILSAIILREGNVFGMKDLIALVLVSIGILIVNWAKPVGEKEKGMN